MFGFMTPKCASNTGAVKDIKSDFKNAEKIGEYRFGDEACYLPENPGWIYIPYQSIDNAKNAVLQVTHSCCSGGHTMPTPSILLHFDGGNKTLQFDTETESKKAFEKITAGQTADTSVQQN